MQKFVNEFQVLIWIANPSKHTVMEKVEILRFDFCLWNGRPFIILVQEIETSPTLIHILMVDFDAVVSQVAWNYIDIVE